MYSFWPPFGKELIEEYSTCCWPLFIFNDSYFGPYPCLSFNAKQKLLFRSSCCLVLIEADISFVDGFHSYAFCRMKFPL